MTQTRTASSGKNSEFRFGRRTLISSAIAFATGGTLFGLVSSIFLLPTMKATGLSSSEVLLAPFFSVGFIFAGPLLLGRIIPRFGPRRVVLVGLPIYIALLLVMALIPPSSLSLHILAVALGLFASFTHLVPLNRVIASWFDKHVGIALGIVGAMGNLAPVFAIPVVAYVIYTWGWQAGYLVLAAIALVICLPAVFIGLRLNPREAELHPASVTESVVQEAASASSKPTVVAAKTPGQVMRTPRFWLLPLAILFVSAGVGGFSQNLQPLLIHGGLTVVQATSITAFVGLGGVLGRLAGGFLFDRLNRYGVFIGVVLVCAAGAAILISIASLPYALIFVAVLMVAVALGFEGDVASYVTLREYGRANFASLFSILIIALGVGAIPGGYMFSIAFDSTGSYVPAITASCGLFLLSIVVIIIYALTGPEKFRNVRPVHVAPAEPDVVLEDSSRVN